MLKDFTVANLLDLNETIAAELFEGKTYPWEVLPEISDFIMKLGPTLNLSMVRLLSVKMQKFATVHLSAEMRS